MPAAPIFVPALPISRTYRARGPTGRRSAGRGARLALVRPMAMTLSPSSEQGVGAEWRAISSRMSVKSEQPSGSWMSIGDTADGR